MLTVSVGGDHHLEDGMYVLEISGSRTLDLVGMARSDAHGGLVVERCHVWVDRVMPMGFSWDGPAPGSVMVTCTSEAMAVYLQGKSFSVRM